MANGFTIEEPDPSFWSPDLRVWLFRFSIKHELGLLSVKVGVSEDIAEEDRSDEAKKRLREFVAAMSAEVASW